MKEEIIDNLDNPYQLEKLYRENKTAFRTEFNRLYPEIHENATARVWNERLNFGDEAVSGEKDNDLTFAIFAALIAGLIVKIPDLTAIPAEYFYQRHLAFIVFPLLAAFFYRKHKFQTKSLIIIITAFLLPVIYINLLPDNSESNTLILACIHLPLFLWSVLGYTFVGGDLSSFHKRLDFLRYNGDLVVMSTIILIAGVILTGITIGLFSLINIDIEEFYLNNIVIWGLAATPIVGTYLVQSNPHLVNRVSPVIAKVFTPLLLATLVVYLIAVIATGKDPYNDREFLIVFNFLLVGVMAIILFSITETSQHTGTKTWIFLLLCLSIVTIAANGIAISAILFRISEWGITPNRLAVLGGNLLILVNLLLVTIRLFKAMREKNAIENVVNSIAGFLPVYVVWTMIVTFVFPIIFHFK